MCDDCSSLAEEIIETTLRRCSESHIQQDMPLEEMVDNLDAHLAAWGVKPDPEIKEIQKQSATN
jgi:hypothetical protein